MSLKRGDDAQPNAELAAKLTLSAPLTDASQLQDGDNSLEPGEVVTPPHQPHKSISNPATSRDSDAKLKKILAKDVMTKTLRKLSRIDTDTCEEKVRAILELEVIKRKEAKLFEKQQPIENGIDAEKKLICTAADALAIAAVVSEIEDNDDSEGLYSDTDSSTDDHRNLEDVQKARKEKQAEAEAARTPAQPPGPHQFYPISPLRFHMRLPCYDFRPMGFMPRMSRGGMRGMRPTYFNKRPVAPSPSIQPLRPAIPVPTASTQSESNTPQTSPSAAYGPALPPTTTSSDSPSKNIREAVTGRAKPQQSDVAWTKAQPTLPFIFNLVEECSNVNHKTCKRRSNQLEESSGSTKKHTSSKGNSTESHRERSKERHKSSHVNEAKSVQKINRSKSKNKSHKERSCRDDSNGKTPPTAIANDAVAELCLTPPPVEPAKEDRKSFDIFAESPPRLSQPDCVLSTTPKMPTRVTTLLQDLSPREPKVLPVEKCIVERSTTPPLIGLCNITNNTPPATHLESKTTPLHKASEIHSRIDALLQDNDLHLEALLATREQLLRKTNEHRKKISSTKETSKASTCAGKEPSQKKLHDEGSNVQEGILLGVRIKQEPKEAQSSISTRHSSELKVDKDRREHCKVEFPSTPSPRQQSLRHDNPFKRETVLNEHSTRHSPNRLTDKRSRNSHERRNEDSSSDRQRKDTNLRDNLDRSGSRDAHKGRHSVLRHGSNEHDQRWSNERHTRSRSRGRGQSSLRNSSSSSKSSEKQAEPKEEFIERTIKIERNRSKTPERRPLTPLQHKPIILHHIKVERDATPPLVDRPYHLKVSPPPAKVLNNVRKTGGPPVLNGNLVNEDQSPDTDDYIDNWENDDSTAGDSSTPKKLVPISRLASQVNGFVDEDDDDENSSSSSNKLWNAKSTPPPKPRYKAVEMLPLEKVPPPKALINIHELYDKFMKSIKMNNTESDARGVMVDATATATVKCSPAIVKCEESSTNGTIVSSSDASKNSSLSNSTAEESSSTESTSSSSSSDDDDDDDEDDNEDEDEDEDNDEESTSDEQASSEEDATIDEASTSPIVSEKDPTSFKQAIAKADSHKRNNVSKDLRKLKSLEDNLARIQMMRENYDSGDDICEELLKMESLFIMQRNAIMDKYRKNDLKLSENKKVEAEQQTEGNGAQSEQLQSPINNIFDANREAIKLTLSPLKLTRKSAILDKDDGESNFQIKATDKVDEKDFTEKLAKPVKEIAIVKPTIMDTKLKRGSTPSRRRTRDRSPSRNRTRRSSLNRMRPTRHRGDSRSMSPRRWTRSRIRFGKYLTRSRSRSFSRSRSRSPNRRRRLKFGRRRNSLSPPPLKSMGPRSPPMRRRSYSRERCSRSPLPFKPPSPPMRRSWSSSQSRSPEHRRSRSPCRRSPFDDYFEENQSLEAAASAAAYYYNISLLHGGEMDPNSEHYESYAAYAAYMDTAYNMSLSTEDAYAQYMEYSNMMPSVEEQMLAALPPDLSTTFYNEYSEALAVEAAFSSVPGMYDMSKAPVAVQKGNVLEIVPSNEPTVSTTDSQPTIEKSVEDPVPAEDTSKPKRKRVNFVDKVLPNNESDDEDRKVVQKAVECAIKKLRERRALPAKLQRMREDLMLLPPPPPPSTVKPPHLEKAIFVGKKPKLHFYHFDPFRAAIVRGPTRLLRPPRFDPKYMAMLMKTGRLPLPRFPFHALRHRPPLPPHAFVKATANVRAVMLKDNLIRIPSHPPPPLDHIMHGAIRPPFFDNFLRLRAPSANLMSASSAASHPIPVLGQAYSFPHVPAPTSISDPTTSPQASQAMADENLLTELLPRNAYGLVVPPLQLTPPPLPDLPSLQPIFSVKSIPTITEIMPVDILEQLGPLPKTLDLDGTPVTDEVNVDLKEADTDTSLTESPVTNSPNAIEEAVSTEDDATSMQQSQQLVESQ